MDTIETHTLKKTVLLTDGVEVVSITRGPDKASISSTDDGIVAYVPSTNRLMDHIDAVTKLLAHLKDNPDE